VVSKVELALTSPPHAQLHPAHDPGDGTGDRGVTQVQLSGFDGGPGRIDRGEVGVVPRHHCVQFLLTQGIDGGQRLGARQIALRLLHRRHGLRQRGLRLRQRRRIGLLINHEQHLSGLDPAAFDRQLLFQNAADARTDLHRVVGLRFRDIIFGHCGGLWRHDDGGDFLRRRCRRFPLGATGYGGKHKQRQEKWPDRRIAGNRKIFMLHEGSAGCREISDAY
jgi:hypothetical protein